MHLKSPRFLEWLTQSPHTPALCLWGRAQEDKMLVSLFMKLPKCLSCGSHWNFCCVLQMSLKGGKARGPGSPRPRVSKEVVLCGSGREALPRGGQRGPQNPPSLRCLFTQVGVDGRESGGPGLQTEARRGGAGFHPGAQPPQPKLKRAPLWKLPRTAPSVVRVPNAVQ